MEDLATNILMEMERLRMDSYEADSVAEKRRLNREYARLWKVVQPMLEKQTPA